VHATDSVLGEVGRGRRRRTSRTFITEGIVFAIAYLFVVFTVFLVSWYLRLYSWLVAVVVSCIALETGNCWLLAAGCCAGKNKRQ